MREDIRVGTWTCDRLTRDWMKSSRDGRDGSCESRGAEVPSTGGVPGGVGGRLFSIGSGPHLMTSLAFCAR